MSFVIKRGSLFIFETSTQKKFFRKSWNKVNEVKMGGKRNHKIYNEGI